MMTLPKLLATSVVRGSEKGQSHGGVYLIDFESERVEQKIDWNTSDIDFTGRGWDRGLRESNLLMKRYGSRQVTSCFVTLRTLS